MAQIWLAYAVIGDDKKIGRFIDRVEAVTREEAEVKTITIASARYHRKTKRVYVVPLEAPPSPIEVQAAITILRAGAEMAR